MTGPAGATGPAVTTTPTVRPKTQTELKMEAGRKALERYTAQRAVPVAPKKTNGTANVIPFSGETIDTGIVAAVTAKRAQTEGIKREMPPAELSPAPKVAVLAPNVLRGSTPAQQHSEKQLEPNTAQASAERDWVSQPHYNRNLRTFRRNSNHCLTGFFGGTCRRNPTAGSGARSLSSQMEKQRTLLIARLGGGLRSAVPHMLGAGLMD